MALGPAAADEPRAAGLNKAQFALGSTTVAFVCWPGVEAGFVPELQVQRSQGWATVAVGQLGVPAGWQGGKCPDAAFSVPVYYQWRVLDSGTATADPGINVLSVREFLPARTTTRTASYTLRVITEKCVNPADGYRVRITRSKKVPGSEIPAKGSRFVTRCNGPVASTKRVPLKARVSWRQRDPAIKGPSITVQVRV
jgi:hypothetical protein